MMRSLRIAAAALAFLALSSCSYVYPVFALFVNGKLTFISDEFEEANPPFCLDQFRVIDDGAETAWEFDASERNQGRTECIPSFPLPYGRTPSGAESLAAPAPIRLGRLYVIDGHGGDQLEGAFVIYRAGDRLVVENIAANSPEVSRTRERYWQTKDAGAATGSAHSRQ